MHVEALNNILHKCIRLLLYSGVYSSVYSVQCTEPCRVTGVSSVLAPRLRGCNTDHTQPDWTWISSS